MIIIVCRVRKDLILIRMELLIAKGVFLDLTLLKLALLHVNFA